MTYTTENPHADGSAAPGARPRYQQPLHRDLPDTSSTHDNWMEARQTSCRQQTAPPQQCCSKDVTSHPHCTARSPSWPSMPGPCLQRAATVWLYQIQPAIRNRMFSEWLLSYAQASWPCLNSRTEALDLNLNQCQGHAHGLFVYQPAHVLVVYVVHMQKIHSERCIILCARLSVAAVVCSSAKDTF